MLKMKLHQHWMWPISDISTLFLLQVIAIIVWYATSALHLISINTIKWNGRLFIKFCMSYAFVFFYVINDKNASYREWNFSLFPMICVWLFVCPNSVIWLCCIVLTSSVMSSTLSIHSRHPTFLSSLICISRFLLFNIFACLIHQ